MLFHCNNVSPTELKPYDIPVKINNTATDSGVLYNPELLSSYLVENLLMFPINLTKPAIVTDNKGNTLDTDDMADILATSLDDVDGNPSDKDHKKSAELLEALLTQMDADYNLPASKLFLGQALGATGLPSVMSSATVLYDTKTDVISSASNYLSTLAQYNNGHTTNQRSYATAHEHLLSLYVALVSMFDIEGNMMLCAQQDDFKDFADEVLATTQMLHSAGKASNKTLDQAQKFSNFDLSDEIVIGINTLTDSDVCAEEYSFGRILGYIANDYTRKHDADAFANNTPEKVMLAPWDLLSAANPKAWYFANVENHARKSAQDINAEWKMLERASTLPIRRMNLNKLKRIGAEQRNIFAMKDEVASRKQNQHRKISRRNVDESDFAHQAPSPAQSARDIITTLKKMARTHRSQNPQVVYRKSANRQSRRNRSYADSAPGKTKRKEYFPDIHFYADTSGSMSLEDYQDTLLLVVAVAKKLNCNVYFSSFSHVLSQEVLLPTKGRSKEHIRKIIKAVPKVTGGTDFQQVWDNINNLDERGKRLNIIATDFGFVPRAFPRIDHPHNVVYVPSFNRANSSNWDYVRRYAVNFTNAMRAHDNTIDAKLLGMGYKPAPFTTK